MEFETVMLKAFFSFADEKNMTPALPDGPRKMRVHLGCEAGGTAIYARVGPQYIASSSERRHINAYHLQPPRTSANDLSFITPRVPIRPE